MLNKCADMELDVVAGENMSKMAVDKLRVPGHIELA